MGKVGVFGKRRNEILNGDCLRMETVGREAGGATAAATTAASAPISPPINRRKERQSWKKCQNGPKSAKKDTKDAFNYQNGLKS